MLIEVRCPNGHVLHVKEKHAGKIGACPHCSTPVRVPLAGQVYGGDRLGVPSLHHSPAEKLAHEEPVFDRSGRTSDSSIALGQSKQCVWCGKIVSHATAKCTAVRRCQLSSSGVQREGGHRCQFDEHRFSTNAPSRRLPKS